MAAPGGDGVWAGHATWHDYFSAYRAKLNAAKESQEVEEEPIAVLVHGHEVEGPKELAGAPGALWKRMERHGFAIEAQRALARMPAIRFRTDSGGGEGGGGEVGHSAGDIRYPAYNLETVAMMAVWRGEGETEGQLIAFEATWERKHPDTAPPLTHKPGSMSFKGARTYDPVLGYEIRVGASKPRKPNSIELEEGIAPPAGFNQWLDAFYPKQSAGKKGSK